MAQKVDSTYSKLLEKRQQLRRYMIWTYNALAAAKELKEIKRLGLKADNLEDELAALNYTIATEEKKHLEILSFPHLMQQYFGLQVEEIDGIYYIQF